MYVCVCVCITNDVYHISFDQHEAITTHYVLLTLCTKIICIKVEEETKEPEPVPEPVIEEVAAVVVEPVKKEPEPEPEPVPVVTAEPGKATIPSKELLESTEKAQAEVRKKGIQETKDKMSSKSSATTKAVATKTPPVEEKKESTEVAKTTKKPGGKRRIAKGVTLIVAAGAVALARNVVKAYLGRTIL